MGFRVLCSGNSIITKVIPQGSKLPRGSYPTPCLGRLLFKITDPNYKTRYPKKGVGYEPPGISILQRSPKSYSNYGNWASVLFRV